MTEEAQVFDRLLPLIREVTGARDEEVTMDSGLMRANNPWFWRIPLETYGDGELMKGLRSVAGYFRASLGPVDWRWIYGNNV